MLTVNQPLTLTGGTLRLTQSLSQQLQTAGVSSNNNYFGDYGIEFDQPLFAGNPLAQTADRAAIALEQAETDWLAAAEATERAVRGFAERHGAKLGAVAQPLRAALTGRTTSPGIFEVLTVLGKSESLARLADQAPPA